MSELRYIYIEQGRLVAEQHLTGDGKISTRISYTYDGEGRRIKILDEGTGLYSIK